MTVYKNKETQKRLLSIQKTYSVAYANQQEMMKKDVDVMEKELNDELVTYLVQVAHFLVNESPKDVNDLSRDRKLN